MQKTVAKIEIDAPGVYSLLQERVFKREENQNEIFSIITAFIGEEGVVGSVVRMFRRSTGLSVSSFAESINFNTDIISRIERGDRKFDEMEIEKISSVYPDLARVLSELNSYFS